jgi:hypothetical protein
MRNSSRSAWEEVKRADHHEVLLQELVIVRRGR